MRVDQWEKVANRIKEVVEKEFGTELKFQMKGFSYSAENCTFKIEAATIAHDGVVNSQERKAFVRLADMYGMAPAFLDKTFKQGAYSFTVTGLNTRRRKYPVCCKRDDGKNYSFTTDTVIRLMRRAHPAIFEGTPAVMKEV